MKIPKFVPAKIQVLLWLAAFVTARDAAAVDNIWINGASGKWETSSNWSAGAPAANQSIYVTNASSKTITIDTITSGSFSNTMSINDLSLFGPSSTVTNSLTLTNAGTTTPLQIAATLSVGSGLSPGFLTIVNSALQVGSTVFLTRGSITLNSGSLNASSGTFQIGRSGNGPGSLTVNGGTLLVTNSGAGTLRLADNETNSLGTLSVTNGEVQARILQVGFLGHGVFTLNGGVLTASSNLVVGVSAGSSGSALITGGTLAVTNAAHNAYVEVRRGSLTVNGGLLQLDNVVLTNTSTSGILGNMTIQSNATVNISSNLTVVSGSLIATSSITINGGSLLVTNGLTQVGPSGNGLMTVSGGNHVFRRVRLGSTNGVGSGGLHFIGGHLKILGTGSGPGQGLVSNWILWEGGDLDGTGTSLTIALTGNSDVTISQGNPGAPATGELSAMYVGAGTGYTGTYTQSGINCQVIVSNQMIVGDCYDSAIGQVTLNAGTLYVTNPMHTAILDVRDGTFTLNDGATLVVDNLIVTNSCGHFVRNGGTLIYNSQVLDPKLDADGDGLSNGLEQSLGMDPLNPSFICAPSGLISWWPAGGNSDDIIGGNNGTLQNGVTFAAGKVGQAFSFDGIDDFIAIGGSPVPPPWTVEFWANRQDSPSYSSVLLADSQTALKLEQYHFTRQVGFTQFGVADYNFNYSAPVGVWTHLAFVANEIATQLYVNGALQDTYAASIALPLEQFGSDGAGDRLKGLVDELSVYNRALSASEIQAIYSAGSAGKCVTPVYIISINKTGNNLSLTWLAQRGLKYHVQFTGNLSSGLWTDVAGDVTATGSTASKTDVLPANAPQRFYRVMLFR
jgi:hypothetical protein